METLGNVINTESSSSISGDVHESWTFLLRFRELLGLQKCFSLEELITELNGPLFDALSEAYILMLQVLLREFTPNNIVKCSTKSSKTKLNEPPLNDLTWPELARRYILVMLMKSEGACEIMDIFRLLYGDGGPKCGALTGIVGLKADALLLAESTYKIYGSLYVCDDKLGLDEKDMHQQTMLNESVPSWVQVLDPVKNMKTNNGSRIRNCINKSLEKDPPEWARKLLEYSVSKGFYKGNASGPTKRLAMHVVSEFHNKHQNLTLTGIKQNLSISKIVMKRCRIMLRRATASKEAKRFCKFLGKNLVKRGNNNKGVLGSPAEVSSLLYFRMIDMRLAGGAYRGSHEAFFEDVQEFWRTVQIEYNNYPTLIKFALKASHVFESLYIKEVVSLLRESEGYSQPKSLSACVLQDIDNDITCVEEIPKAPWDEGVCKVCGINSDDGKVLLCDECDAEYHTYCLNPQLVTVPEGNWFCPCCVANKCVEDVSPNASFVNQLEMKKDGEFVTLIRGKTAALETMIRGKEKWELSFHEKTLLLKFICDQMLDSSFLRDHLDEVEDSSLRREYIGNDFDSKSYWSVGSGTKKPWVVVNHTNRLNKSSSTLEELSKDYMLSDIDLLAHKGSQVCSIWNYSRSRGMMQEVVDFLEGIPIKNSRAKANLEKFREYTLLEDNSILDLRGDIEKEDNLKVKATKALEFRYSSCEEVIKCLKRCECLEPIFPTGDHCPSCHKTCFTLMDYKLHIKSGCSNIIGSKISDGVSNSMGSKGKEKMITCSLNNNLFGVDEGLEIDKLFNVPAAASLRPLTGRASQTLTQLKLNLLDMEAAVPSDAMKPSRTCTAKKWAWRSFLKHASTIYEMVHALIVFEDMIKLEYLDRSWRLWASLSAAANMSTLAALSLRIYSLDAAISYEKISPPSNSSGPSRRANKRNPGRKRKSESKK